MGSNLRAWASNNRVLFLPELAKVGAAVASVARARALVEYSEVSAADEMVVG